MLREPPIVEVPCTAGKPRNYHAKKKKPTTSSSRPPKTHTTQQPSAATQGASSESQLPPPTAATTSPLSTDSGTAEVTGACSIVVYQYPRGVDSLYAPAKFGKDNTKIEQDICQIPRGFLDDTRDMISAQPFHNGGLARREVNPVQFQYQEVQFVTVPGHDRVLTSKEEATGRKESYTTLDPTGALVTANMWSETAWKNHDESDLFKPERRILPAS
ncbi:hypothetical protein BDR05DRAFT_947989 [Suillus weaverae]|nr:hypothetical protein BDR05DRAFT_947989 [Suillus weaverae]